MTDETQAREYLSFIPADKVSYEEWIDIGMAIKAEGLPLDLWDSWSQKDSRYKEGDCARRWSGFNGSGTTGATLTHYAKEYGWTPAKKAKQKVRVISFTEDLTYFERHQMVTIDPTTPLFSDPAEQLKEQIKALFQPGEKINIVKAAEYIEDKDKWIPKSKGITLDRETILKRLDSHLGIDGFIGDRNKDAGVWLRINPVDGNGVNDSNVTSFRHVLIESDSLPIEKQIELYQRLEFPITTLTLSGGKSVHALVRVDAKDKDEYRERVKTLFQACKDEGMEVDKANRNPARLSRLAGVERGSQQQSLLKLNIGLSSFEEWEIEHVADHYPEYESLDDLLENPPELPPEMIRGVLRRGEKLVLTGPSKAGKSFALIQLAIACATGTWWMNRFKCEEQRVVYINFELTKENARKRILDTWNAARGNKKEGLQNLFLWNLRGEILTATDVVNTIIKRHNSMVNKPDLYIVDPIYKINSGDENSAKDMNELLREFDRLLKETGANIAYAHHHAKGSQFGKRALDRGSGSGVIGRDADAAIDLDFLFVPEKIRREKAEYYNDKSWMKATGLRAEMTLRNFENKPPFNIWFKYPVHKYDSSEEFQALKGESEKNNFDKAEDGKQRKKTATDDRIKFAIEDLIEEYGTAQMKDIEDETGLTRKRIKQYIDSSNDFERNENGQVSRVGLSGKSQSHLDSD